MGGATERDSYSLGSVGIRDSVRLDIDELCKSYVGAVIKSSLCK